MGAQEGTVDRRKKASLNWIREVAAFGQVENFDHNETSENQTVNAVG